MTEKLLTLFSCPKPFVNPHIVTIQRNAVQSWTHLGPEVDVILMNDDEGVGAAAAEFGVRHMPNVACSERGAPLIDSMFRLARENSNAPFLVYVNADIIMMPDLIPAVQSISQKLSKFLLVGQRWDLDVRAPLDFSSGWEARLRERVKRDGKLHTLMGIDCFVFPRDCYTDIPSFVIGRAGWDNWMLYKAYQEKWPRIDLTPSVMIVHQDHDYSHLPNQTYYGHPETEENIRLAGGKVNTRFTLLDVNRRLVKNRLRPALITWFKLMRQVELFVAKINNPPRRFLTVLYNYIYLHRVKWQERG
jgi:hypothetical protein